ncbi:MAG: ABC transporter ATP-binding protein [Ktedonobacterales bacterium]|nr:ABC transporter ATP-binding protein [Ktedonobacterales bacterium]
MATIEFVGVTKRFPGASQAAVDTVNLTVPDGSLCMLLGTSGSGKTTLLRMVNRLIEPTSGEIRIDGSPNTAQDQIALRRSIGYVIQQVGLFPHMTIAENVRVVPSIEGKSKQEVDPRVDELLSLVGLEPKEYRNRYPRQLSGGQQQRVGLARALAADPALLLMDEPFGALDAITRERLQDELRRIQRDVHKTIIFVTHDVQEALKLGDQLVVMSDGHIIQAGPPTELLLHPATPFVARLLGADNVVSLYEHVPVSTVMEPPNGYADGMRIAASAPVLQALVQLVQTNQPALAVEENGTVVGQITQASIYRQLRTPIETAQAATAKA